jgi:putative phosphoribosyl transferase
MIFKDRVEAGQLLADKLREIPFSGDLIVLAIPKGGVVVGKEISRSLNCPLNLVLIKKIGAPKQSELAIGAVGYDGRCFIDENLASKTGADKDFICQQTEKLKDKIRQELEAYGSGEKLSEIKDKTVIIVDDGVATGATMKAAVELVWQTEPRKVIVAVPVLAKESLAMIEAKADQVIFLESLDIFFSVSQSYQNFEQVSVGEVINLLKEIP